MKKQDAEKSFVVLKEQLKVGDLKQMYLICGEEQFLKKDYFNRLMKAFGGQDGDMNTNFYDGKGQNVGQIIDQAETLPFLAEKRVICIRESGLFKSGGDALADYLKEPCESTVFLFYENDVDERTKLFKQVKDAGHVAQIDHQSENFLKASIAGFMKKEGKRISMVSVDKILEKTGADLNTIRTELEKLVCYSMDRDIVTEEDVDLLCSETLENKVFDLIEAVVRKNAKKSLELYYDLLALKVEPINILSLMERQYRLLLHTKTLRETMEVSKIHEVLKIQPFLVNKLLSQGSGYSKKALKSALEKCVETDSAVKSGRITGVLGVETLIMTLLPEEQSGE